MKKSLCFVMFDCKKQAVLTVMLPGTVQICLSGLQKSADTDSNVAKTMPKRRSCSKKGAEITHYI